jgi:hypothetical protein
MLIGLVIYGGKAARHQNSLHRRDSIKIIDAVSGTPAPIQTPIATPLPSPADSKERAVAALQAIYSAPISFYGQVKDQFGVPVAGARVDYTIVDKFFDPGSKSSGISDGQGYFALDGVKGAALTVGISKAGYAPIYGQSNGSFAFGMPLDPRRDRPTPNRDQPAIFVLRKKLAAEPLIVVERDVRLPKDGTAVEVSLRTGKPVPVDHGDLKIECWTSDSIKDAKGHYEWHAKVSILGGGLIVRKDPEREFQAPDNGYLPNIDVSMPITSTRWERNYDGHYWVMLRDRTYARVRFRLTTAGAHFATISSYLNPSGSRNLEFDEDKVIK